QDRLGAVEELARRLAVLRVLEDVRVAALELPRGEEERPVDVLDRFGERHLDAAPAEEGRRRRVRVLDARLVRVGVGVRGERADRAAGVQLAQRLLVLAR